MAKSNISIEELLAESKQKLRDLKTKVCRKCKEEKRLVQSNYCAECYKDIAEKRAAKRQNSRHEGTDGYVRVYDDEDKLVLEHRFLMEKHLGRKLQKGEIVLHLDGVKSNNNLSNLALGLRNGTPFTQLKCNSCGTIGEVSL